MTLPGARAGAWAAAAKVARRRRRTEGAGRSLSPVTPNQRAALYVHVSGKEVAELRGLGGASRNLPSDLPPADFPCLPGEALDGTWCPGREMSGSRDSKFLVLTSSVTLNHVISLQSSV